MTEARVPLILGGAGFIGSNLARHLIERGQPVLIFDNLDAGGSEHNLRALRAEYGQMAEVQLADLRDRTAVRRAIARASCVFHFAVTTSLGDPILDFEVNLRGTVDLLEELRQTDRHIPLIYTSTGKVYGAMQALPLVERATRWEPADPWIAEHGIDEQWPLDLCSPYGCSKSGADQYVLEYTRCYGLPAVVTRLGSIYGPNQRGGEGQGWVAHFLARAIEREPITIHGDGKQVRDLLHVDDLVEAFLRLLDQIDEVKGNAFNIGGGAANAVSLGEMLELMSGLLGQPTPVTFSHWRNGDQRYYVSNNRKLEATTGWTPQVSVLDGVRRLYQWMRIEQRMAAPSPLAHAAQAGA
jgi:CDP-paratose 2-epimerase